MIFFWLLRIGGSAKSEQKCAKRNPKNLSKHGFLLNVYDEITPPKPIFWFATQPVALLEVVTVPLQRRNCTVRLPHLTTASVVVARLAPAARVMRSTRISANICGDPATSVQC